MKGCFTGSIHVYFTKQFICPELRAGQRRVLVATEQTPLQLGQVGDSAALMREKRRTVSLSPKTPPKKKTEKRMTLKEKKEREVNARVSN